MRLALAHLVFDPRSSARGLQTVLDGIGRALRGDAPPDVVILPGGCDFRGQCPPRDASEAALSAVREAIALSAREWGVYIAAGLHRWSGSGYEPLTALFDRDGDLVLGLPDELAASSGWTCLHYGDAGDIGCYDPLADGDTPASLDVAARGALIVSCLPAFGGQRDRRIVEERLAAIPVPARGGTVVWAVCRPGQEDRDDPCSFVMRGDGTRLCEAGGRQESILFVDLPIAPASAQEREALAALRDQAD